MLISVIMSVYNEEEYIKEAIDSILNQTIQDFEIIIFDDCSSDSTVEIIKNIDDSRIRLFENKENAGLTKNLNRALKLCNGDYIARMDGDDISKPERFEKQIFFLKNNSDVDLISCNTETIGNVHLISDISGNSMELKCRMLLRPQLAHPGFMMRRKVVYEYGFKYDEYFRSAQDYDFAARLSRNYKIGVTKEVLLQYRTHEGQVSNNVGFNQKRFAHEIRQRLLSEIGVNSNDDAEIIDKWAYEESVTKAEYVLGKKLLKEIIISVKRSGSFEYKHNILRRTLWQEYYKWLLRTGGWKYVMSIFNINILRYVELLYTGIAMIYSKVRRKRMGISR